MSDTDVPPLPDYLERIITFVDILGFSHDTRELEHRPALGHSINAILQKIGNCKRDWEAKRASSGIAFDAQFTHFSDCLVMSYDPKPGALRRSLADAAFIGQMILRHGYLPRGVILSGKLRHDGAVLYGAGMIDAYEFERDKVVQPRIAIHDSICDRLRNEIETRGSADEFDRCLRNRGAGLFVHVAGNYWPFVKQLADPVDPSGLQALFEEQRRALPLRCSGASARVREKIEWMADYLNETIDELKLPGSLRIQLPPK